MHVSSIALVVDSYVRLSHVLILIILRMKRLHGKTVDEVDWINEVLKMLNIYR